MCIINTRASVDHDCELGDFVHVGPGAVITGSVTVGNGTDDRRGIDDYPGVDYWG